MNNNPGNPAPWALAFLRTICPDHLLEEIEGDLFQKFERDTKVVGEKKAKIRFVWNSMRFFRPGILLRNKIQSKWLNADWIKIKLFSNRMDFQRTNNLMGWLVFCVALLSYFLSVEETASYWDCTEFIATSYKLEVPHPPGAPLFL